MLTHNEYGNLFRNCFAACERARAASASSFGRHTLPLGLTLPPPHRSLVAAQANARKPVVWEDLTTGKYHAINNDTGELVPVDRDGRPIAQFYLGISGCASTQERTKMRLKDVALLQSLCTAEPPRPAGLKDAALLHSMREDRVETRGRFRVKPTPEPLLFLRYQKYFNETYPEVVAAAKAEDDKARRSIEEMHKNYYALQASTAAGVAAVQKVNVGATKPISKSYLCFTATGVFRP